MRSTNLHKIPYTIENIPPNKGRIDIVACKILGFGRPCVLDFPLCEVYTLIQPMKINEGGEPLRKAHRKFLQAGLLLCILSAFLVCPFGVARVAPERSAEAGRLPLPDRIHAPRSAARAHPNCRECIAGARAHSYASADVGAWADVR